MVGAKYYEAIQGPRDAVKAINVLEGLRKKSESRIPLESESEEETCRVQRTGPHSMVSQRNINCQDQIQEFNFFCHIYSYLIVLTSLVTSITLLVLMNCVNLPTSIIMSFRYVISWSCIHKQEIVMSGALVMLGILVRMMIMVLYSRLSCQHQRDERYIFG